MDLNEILLKTESHVRELLEGEGTGHDWWHIHRVRNIALKIAKIENANLFIVELAALLHDIGDHKFFNGDETMGRKLASAWLLSLNVENQIIESVCDIIDTISFKGAGIATQMTTIEGMIVQDADRLDALGAIGIARTFAFGGAKGREFYNPEIKPVMHNDFDAYKSSKAPTINHFYEKLLLLKDRMNTQTGRQLAEKRHVFMEIFLKEFFEEWEGELI